MDMQVGLLDSIQQLGVTAHDVIISHLVSGESIASLRKASKGLMEFVDSNVREVTITPLCHPLETLPKKPLLVPRCTAVTFDLRMPEYDGRCLTWKESIESIESIAARIQISGHILRPEIRARIKRLTVTNVYKYGASLGIAGLIAMLPALEEVLIGDCCGGNFDWRFPLNFNVWAFELLMQSTSSLSHIKSLRIPFDCYTTEATVERLSKGLDELDIVGPVTLKFRSGVLDEVDIYENEEWENIQHVLNWDFMVEPRKSMRVTHLDFSNYFSDVDVQTLSKLSRFDKLKLIDIKLCALGISAEMDSVMRDVVRTLGWPQRLVLSIDDPTTKDSRDTVCVLAVPRDISSFGEAAPDPNDLDPTTFAQRALSRVLERCSSISNDDGGHRSKDDNNDEHLCALLVKDICVGDTRFRAIKTFAQRNKFYNTCKYVQLPSGQGLLIVAEEGGIEEDVAILQRVHTFVSKKGLMVKKFYHRNPPRMSCIDAIGSIVGKVGFDDEI